MFWVALSYISYVLLNVSGSAVRTCQLLRCDHFCQGNSFEGYRCVCRNGHHLGDDGKTCHDDDECDDDWKIAHGCEYNCVNTEGSYKCVCPPGHTVVNELDGRMHCDDIDECENGEQNCEQMCVNEPGSYHCACHEGFLLVNGHTCVEKEISGRWLHLDTVNSFLFSQSLKILNRSDLTRQPAKQNVHYYITK